MEQIVCQSWFTNKILSFVLLFITLHTIQIYSQQMTEEQRAGMLAHKFFSQSNNPEDNGGNSPEAIQEKFFTGQAAGDYFGYSVSTAGDVNGDGYSDMIVGAYKNDTGGNDAGRAYIYLGGNIFNSTADVILTGAAAGDNFGISVSTAGDVNGDGYSDLIVGSYLNDAGGTNAGRAYIYFGGSIMDSTKDVILTGAAADDRFGISVSTAGDVNGDGYSDVIVGSYLNDAGGTDAGRAYIYFGGSIMDSTKDVILTGAAAGDNFGWSAYTAGDVNGDGYSDVIVGSPNNDAGGSNAGRAYIYFGGSIMDSTKDVFLTGAADNDEYGISVSIAGDVNGDGYSDVIVGAYWNDAGGSNAGRAYIYFGGESMNSTADVILTGAAADDRFGNSVSTAGDVNGDGYSDVIVGAKQNDAEGSNAGRAYIYFGGESMDSTKDVILTSAAAGDNFGISVSTAGDVNGDGYSDVIVGAHWNDVGGTDAGRAYLYTNSLTGTDIPDEFFTGAAAGDQFGYSVSTTGDVNGDGFDDVIVGANYNSHTGRAYIYFGGASMNSTADVILTGEAAGDLFGNSVSTAGDVNGDGYTDVIVGAFSNDALGEYTGRAYIYFGGASMDSTKDVILTGAATEDFLGFSVSTAGDVNGDGYSDVIVGSDGNDAGGSNAGRAYIYFGGASMDSTKDVILTGEAAGDLFGNSVSTAGDVNGDGYTDVIVGAFSNDALGEYTGRAYIYFGGASMDSTKDVILTGAAAGDNFGISVSTAGDVNGDGYSDVIVGANRNDAGGIDAGRAYIYFGGASMDSTKDVILTGEAVNDYFGNSVSTAGDVNGDGYSDVIVGADGNDAGGSEAGRAYEYFGGSIMDSTKDVILTGATADDRFGISVSTAGDFNGDGYSDVIVGAHWNDAGGTGAGRAYLYVSSSPPIKPSIMNVKDVPNDQGGYLLLKFVRSGLDAININQISGYAIEMSEPPIHGYYSWIQIGFVLPLHYPNYTILTHTLYDSSTSSSGTFYFRVTARNVYTNEFYYSNIMSGHSIDNLSPATVMSFKGLAQGDNNKLSWKANNEPDLKNYYVYRAFTSTINSDTCTAVLVTADTTGLDSSVPPGDSYYFIRAKDIHDNFGPLAQIASPLPLRQINFTALIEGFYDNVSNLMVEDTVTLELKNISVPYATIDQGKVMLSSNGNGLVKFRQAANSTSYYLVVKHRNSIETWSKLGQQFTNSEMIYNFTSSSNQAFGDNMKLKGSKWTIFSGDVNQDGAVDLADLTMVDNDSYNFVTGYVPTDINGNGSVEATDMNIVDNNAYNYVSSVTPTTLAKPKAVTKELSSAEKD